MDACDISPARADQVVAVGASDAQDRQASFSNYGSCVWMYAPGHRHRLRQARRRLAWRMSGTSMASPHVAGVAALYKEKNPAATPNDIVRWLADQSTDERRCHTWVRVRPDRPPLHRRSLTPTG